MYLFIHIPKTGGTTFSHILSRNFPGKFYSLQSSRQFEYFNKEELASIGSMFPKDSFVSSHAITYPFPSPYSQFTSYSALTFLRHPVNRIFSDYLFMQKRFREGAKKLFASYPIEQAYWKSKKYHLEKTNGVFAPWWNQQSYMLNRDRNGAEAINSIDKEFVFFGLVERFDESLLLFRQAMKSLGQNVDIRYESQNTGQRLDASKQLSRSTYDQIALDNNTDFELYDAAVKIFDKRVQNYSGDFERDLYYFRKACSRYRSVQKIKSGIKHLRRFR